MKGIILAGGTATRLFPSTLSVSKQILPVYNKPMIYYPLSILMIAGIKEILVITTERDLPLFQDLLKDGNHFGINIEYKTQEKPSGIAQSFLIGEEFIGEDSVCLILGDNIFNGYEFKNELLQAKTITQGAVVFSHPVPDPERYGVVEFDENLNAKSIEEKPKKPKSHHAVTGLYFYGNEVVEIAKNIQSSERGELEITDVNREFLRRGKLQVIPLCQDTMWVDAGTHTSFLQASQLIYEKERDSGILIGSPERISFENHFIHVENFMSLTLLMANSEYGQSLARFI